MESKNKQVKGRKLWADVIRVVAIFLVVQIHTLPGSPSGIYLFLSILSYICVPLFIMLSGALLLGKQESYKVFFGKRLIKVVIPWIFWTFVYMFFYYYVFHQQTIAEFFSNGSDSSIRSWMQFFIRTFLSSLWFLPLIFSLYIITPLLRIFVKKAKIFDSMYFLVLWFLVISALPFLFFTPFFPTWEPNLLFTTLQYSGYFLLGFVLAKQTIFKGTSNNLLTLLILGTLPILIQIVIIKLGYPSTFAGSFLAPGIVISTIAFFSFLKLFFRRIESKISMNTRKIFATVSNTALGVYVIHQLLSFPFITSLHHILGQYHLEFVSSLLIFLLSVVIVLILQKTPIIKHIVP